MIPFSLQEMRESPRSDMHQVVEDGRNDRLRLYLKVEACFLRQSQHLFENESCRFLENRIDTRVDETRVALSFLLGYENMILDVEV